MSLNDDELSCICGVWACICGVWAWV